MKRQYTRNDKKISSTDRKIVGAIPYLVVLVLAVIIIVIVIQMNKASDNTSGTMELADTDTNISTPTAPPVIIYTKQPMTTPTPTTQPREILPEIEAYMQQNPDTVGYINIPNTDIGYPVVQTTDNEFYLSHDFDGSESKQGSIYLDYRCEYDEPNQNSIVYGHHMKDGTMFAGLEDFKNEDFFNQNRYIEYSTPYETYTWEIFSVFVTDTGFYYIETDFDDETEWLEFIQECQSKSIYETDIKLYANDAVLTLSTCTYVYDNARLVVQARLIP